MTKLFYPALLALVFSVGAPAASNDPALKHFHFVSPSLQVDGTEVPMFGKWNRSFVNLGGDPKMHTIWVTKFSSKVIEDGTGAELPDYLCHSQLGENGRQSYMTSRYFGNHGGAASTQLPEGFAVPMKVSAKQPVLFSGMVADYANRGLKKKVHVEFDTDYYEDQDAKKLGLKALEMSMMFAHVEDKAGSLEELRKGAHSMHGMGMHGGMAMPEGGKHEMPEMSAHEMPMKMDKVEKGIQQKYNNVHWYVPPGKHEYRTEMNDQLPAVAKGDIRVFHIHAHAHPYAQFHELYDATDKKSLFRGRIETFPDRTVSKYIEPYSSTEGILLKKGHKYEMVVSYDNTTAKPISAMLTYRIFYRNEGAERK